MAEDTGIAVQEPTKPTAWPTLIPVLPIRIKEQSSFPCRRSKQASSRAKALNPQIPKGSAPSLNLASRISHLRLALHVHPIFDLRLEAIRICHVLSLLSIIWGRGPRHLFVATSYLVASHSYMYSIPWIIMCNEVSTTNSYMFDHLWSSAAHCIRY